MGKALKILKKLVLPPEDAITPEILSEEELLAEIDRSLSDLNHARLLFQNVCDPEAVDACVYKIKSAEARYNYLLRVAKETNTIRPTFDFQ